MPEVLFNVGLDETSQDFNISFSDTSQDMDLNLGEVQVVNIAESDHDRLGNRELANQHPISAITGLDDALSGILQDRHFTFIQNGASEEWVIDHQMNKMPTVSIVDSAGNAVVGEVQYISLSRVIVTFRGAFSGRAYLN